MSITYLFCNWRFMPLNSLHLFGSAFHPLPSCNHSFVLCIYKSVFILFGFLHFTYNWDHAIFVFLCLAYFTYHNTLLTSLVAQTVKSLPAMPETRVQSLVWEDLLEKEMATHASILACKIPWMEEPGRLQSMGSQRVGHDWVPFFLKYLLGLFMLHLARF